MTAIGIDIVEIKRLKKTSKKWGKAFLAKVYTKREIAYSMNKRYPYQHLAARFAAKEAIFKALGEVATVTKRQGGSRPLPYVGLEDVSSGGTGQFLGSSEPQSDKSTTFEFSRITCYKVVCAHISTKF